MFPVILNNEVLNNLPEDLKLKLLNNKNLTRQLMHMQNNNNNNQYMYDEKDYTAPAGRDYWEAKPLALDPRDFSVSS